jgi:hypothetical protein
MADQPRRYDCVRFPAGQDALLFLGLRTILKARALHSNLRARAGFRDARSGALHGVTSEAFGAAGGAPCQWSERHRIWREQQTTFACRCPD